MATTSLREPVVAGQFYPADGEALREEVARYIGDESAPERYLGGLCPHAGYIYSGATAGALFARLSVPATVVLLGPKHHGAGAGCAVWGAGAWRTPLGDAAVDVALADALVAAGAGFVADEAAHRPEHSLEVVLPFVQFVNPAARIVPVALAPTSLAAVRAMGEALAAAVAPRQDEVVIIVSSDMTHYESAAAAERKDRLALDRLEALDEEGLLAVTREHAISMCGVWPAAVALVAFRALGASRGTLIKYASSGDASGDYGRVVGYAAVAFA